MVATTSPNLETPSVELQNFEIRDFGTLEREIEKIQIAGEILRTNGSLRMRVLGASMIPTIWPGDIVTIQNRMGNDIGQGAIVLASRNGRFFIHRIVRKFESPEGSRWISRGDSMTEEDPVWSDCEMLGRVTKIERRGRSLLAETQLSFFSQVVGRLLCNSNLLRNLVLRAHSIFADVIGQEA
jgi:hypothetical protein